ncbi:MAG: teichoic acid transporter [Eggerthellaceae bacterium]|nr:teichoic acid transporter [Eggerthellaceae bacterium]
MPKHSKDNVDLKDDFDTLEPDDFEALEPSLAPMGTVSYLDGSVLKRPLTLPKKFWPLVAIIAAVALMIAYTWAKDVDHNVVHHSDRVEENVVEQINRGVSQDVPILSDYIDWDDDEIIQSFIDSGYTYVDMNEINGTGDASIDIIKLPSDMTFDEAAIAYTQGVSKLDSETAARFLSGSWRMMVVRESGYSYSVKYADFDSPDSAAAVQAAVEAQGFGESELGEAGIDNSGNTFQEGTIDIDDYTYHWTVSACDLSDVYSVSGLPENAQYVGVRLTT